MRQVTLCFLLLLTALTSMLASANEPTELQALQLNWAETRYGLEGEARSDAFLELMAKVDKSLANNPGKADFLVWSAIIRASYAESLGGLDALGEVKRARNELEEALELGAEAYTASAHTTLTALYAEVPGWPIGFGSAKKARKHFKEALALDPKGMDSNFLYAKFLFKEKEFQSALDYLNQAEAAEPRPGFELADQGRQKDILELRQEVEARL